MDLSTRELDRATAEELEPLTRMEPSPQPESVEYKSDPASSPLTMDSIDVNLSESQNPQSDSVIYEKKSNSSQSGGSLKVESTNGSDTNLKLTNQPSDCGQSPIENDSGTGSNEEPKPDIIITIVPDDNVSMISSTQGDMCRICHCVAEENEILISPCACCGSMKWVHQQCLQLWVKSSDTRKCELCGYPFNMTSSVKPFRKWSKLNMSSVERRKVLCSVTFHVVAITCVIWSLYVLIDRTTQEIQEGELNWPFWTKLVVVAIGFTGGVVFMYVQCKMYVQLFKKWKQFNRVIYINEIAPEIDPEKQLDPNTSQPCTNSNPVPSTGSRHPPASTQINIVKHDIIVSYVAST